MTDNEVISRCIEKYYEVYTHILLNQYDIHEYLKSQYCDNGICFFSRKVLSVDISSREWILDNTPEFKQYWHRIPKMCDYYEDIIYAIKFRLDKLKEILTKINEDES